MLWRFEGDAFGDVQPTNPTTTAFTMPLRMAGQYYDAEVGTSYNYFKDYDPSTGRYVESDPIGLKGGNNTYGYVGGSPLIRVDSKGLLYIAYRVELISPTWMVFHLRDKKPCPDDSDLLTYIGLFTIRNQHCNFICYFSDAQWKSYNPNPLRT